MSYTWISTINVDARCAHLNIGIYAYNDMHM